MWIKRIITNQVFKDMAEVGKSTMGWFYGFKLHLVVCDDRGGLLNFCLTKGKGYISKKLFDALWNDGIHLVTGIKSNMKNQLMGMREKILLRNRLPPETNISSPAVSVH